MTKKRKRHVNFGLAARAHLDRAQDHNAFVGSLTIKLQDALRDGRCGAAIDLYHRAAVASGLARAHLLSVEATTVDERSRKQIVARSIFVGHAALTAERARLKQRCMRKRG